MEVFEVTKALIEILLGLGCAHETHIRCTGAGGRCVEAKITEPYQYRELRVVGLVGPEKVSISLFQSGATTAIVGFVAREETMSRAAEWLAGKRGLTL